MTCPCIWCFCSSPEYNEAVRRIDQKLNVTNATLVKVPFDLERWTQVAAEDYPNGLPKPYSDDPTQWIFHGHPCGSVIWDEGTKWTNHGPRRTDPTVLQVAVARLLGYHWPAENDPDMELADEARAWVEKTTALHPFADEDGIVCIPSVARERPAHERLLQLLQAAWGDDWSDDILAKLLTATESSSLDDWLRNRFFEEHCKLFHQRPFVWHIWDGRRRDGFHALINYHKLAEGGGKGRRLLESLTYSYLGDWITRQQDGVKRGEGGAEDRLAAALELQKRLVAILAGEPPFDLFIRWKPIRNSPSAGSRTSTTACASISVPSWPKTSPTARKVPASSAPRRTSIGKRTAARNRCATRSSSLGSGTTATSPENESTTIGPKQRNTRPGTGRRTSDDDKHTARLALPRVALVEVRLPHAYAGFRRYLLGSTGYRPSAGKNGCSDTWPPKSIVWRSLTTTAVPGLIALKPLTRR